MAGATTPHQYVMEVASEWSQNHAQFLKECSETLVAASQAMADSIRSGGKVIAFGNGGSAADSQHFAAEMTGRMILERAPLPALALTTDTSSLTAVGNDYGFVHVFERQIKALAKKEDVIVAISTSGNSENVLLAVDYARKLGCKVISLTGGKGGKLRECSDYSLNVSSGKNPSRIQEIHIFALHNLVDLLDRYFLVK